MVKIELKELAKIPYLRADLAGDRSVSITPFWDGTSWHVWINGPDGTLLPMKPPGCGEARYVGREPADTNDLHFPFADFVWRRASWADVAHWSGALVEDVHQLAASVAKIDFFWDARDRVPGGGLGLRRFVSSELEYLLVVCRSVFDLLQEVIRAIWGHVRLLDEDQQRRKRELRSSFADMVMSNGKLMTVEQIAATRRVPLPLATVYADAGAFLKVVRELRDGLIHHGKETPMVMTTDRGFVIGRLERGFDSLPMWKPEHTYNENVVSLRPALAYLVVTTLYACNAFAGALESMFAFPPDLAPGHRLFIRSVHGEALVRAQAVLRGSSPWWSADAGASLAPADGPAADEEGHRADAPGAVAGMHR